MTFLFASPYINILRLFCKQKLYYRSFRNRNKTKFLQIQPNELTETVDAVASVDRKREKINNYNNGII